MQQFCQDLICLALEFKPGVEVTEGDLPGTVIAKSPRDDDDDSTLRHRKKKESVVGDDDLVSPSQPAHLLSVLDR